jgi:hypothetical protein
VANLEIDFDKLNLKNIDLEKNSVICTENYNRLVSIHDEVLERMNSILEDLELAESSLKTEMNSHYQTKDEYQELEKAAEKDLEIINKLEKELTQNGFELNSLIEKNKTLTDEIDSTRERNLVRTETFLALNINSNRLSISNGLNNSESFRSPMFSPKSSGLKPVMVNFGCQTRETNQETAFDYIFRMLSIIVIFTAVYLCSEYLIY